jgi:hypothetical protein
MSTGARPREAWYLPERSMLFRCALACCALLLFFACSGDSTLATGTTEGGGGSTPIPCEQEPECGDAIAGCIACAELGECVEELNACSQSNDCVTFGKCLENCSEGDDDCVNICENQFALGSAIYHNLFVCVFCQVCYSICDGASRGCTV